LPRIGKRRRGERSLGVLIGPLEGGKRGTRSGGGREERFGNCWDELLVGGSTGSKKGKKKKGEVRDGKKTGACYRRKSYLLKKSERRRLQKPLAGEKKERWLKWGEKKEKEGLAKEMKSGLKNHISESPGHERQQEQPCHQKHGGKDNSPKNWKKSGRKVQCSKESEEDHGQKPQTCIETGGADKKKADARSWPVVLPENGKNWEGREPQRKKAEDKPGRTAIQKKTESRSKMELGFKREGREPEEVSAWIPKGGGVLKGEESSYQGVLKQKVTCPQRNGGEV